MHNINVEDFENWLNKSHEIEFASSFGKGSDKQLFIVSNSNLIKVRDHNFIVYEGRNINDAVRNYNNCV